MSLSGKLIVVEPTYVSVVVPFLISAAVCDIPSSLPSFSSLQPFKNVITIKLHPSWEVQLIFYILFLILENEKYMIYLMLVGCWQILMTKFHSDASLLLSASSYTSIIHITFLHALSLCFFIFLCRCSTIFELLSFLSSLLKDSVLVDFQVVWQVFSRCSTIWQPFSYCFLFPLLSEHL